MKLLKSTEIKIALFALAGLFLLVWGINFLKGIDVFKKHCTYYVIFEKTAGLLPAHLVTINGMNVGIVEEIELTSDVPNKVLVRIDVNKSISIPINSVIRIATPNPLSSPQVEILMGNEKQYIQHGDTIQGTILTGALDNLGGIVSNLDTSIVILKTVLQGSILTELEETITNLRLAGRKIDRLLADNSPKVNTVVSDVQAFTTTLHRNDEKINQIIGNLHSISENLAQSEIKQTVDSLSMVAGRLHALLDKVNQGEGTLGQLVVNDSLYIGLEQTLTSLNLLLQDIQANPKRYINVTVFGKKDKKN